MNSINIPSREKKILSILNARHGIQFCFGRFRYSGAEIKIEQRPPEEVTEMWYEKRMAPEGETISSKGLYTNLGGKGFNQSIALARAGLPVFHAGLVGEDGAPFFEAYKKDGINTDYIKTVSGRCGHTIIQVDDNGQNSIVLFGGANQDNTRDNVDEVLSNFTKGDVLLLQNEINELSYIIDKAYDKHLTIILNPSPLDKKIYECDLSKISIFILNETEGNQLTGKEKPEDIIAALSDMYPKAEIMLTLGSEGSIYYKDGKSVFQKAFKVKAVDTTAAGDTFTGYFVAGIIAGKPIEEVLLTATKASALAVLKKGAAQSIPSRNEIG